MAEKNEANNQKKIINNNYEDMYVQLRQMKRDV